MTPEEIAERKKTADRMRRVAKDMEETARGSSRFEMYKSLADELRELATKVETAK